MKILRNILTALFLVTGISSFAQNIITETEANITITGATTREDLMDLRRDLLTQGFDFRYVPQFDSQRKLISITFTITTNDGNLSGSGEHTALQATGAKLKFVVNKSTNTVTVDNGSH